MEAKEYLKKELLSREMFIGADALILHAEIIESYASQSGEIESITDKEIEKEIHKHLDSLTYLWGYPSDYKETLSVHIGKFMRDTLSAKGKEEEVEHYKFEEGIMICNYLKKECPINDTVAGSTCPMCVHNPNQTEMVYNTEK